MAGTDARVLASWLAEADDDALIPLLRARAVPVMTGWNDFFDAAEALLEPASLARGAAALSRAQVEALLEAVRTGGAVADGDLRRDLVGAGMIRPDGVPFAAAARTVAALPRHDARTGTDPASPAPSATDRGPTDHRATDDARAAEHAFAALASLADILYLALRTPLSRTGAGTLGATDRRRLVDEGAVADADAAADLIAIAVATGLLRTADREWRVTDEGRAWLRRSSSERWGETAARLRDDLPALLRSPDGGWVDAGQWPLERPLDPQWPATSTALTARWRRWGLIDSVGRPPSWARAFAAGGPVDIEGLRSLLPPEVDRIFLQNDLTAIAPGPLEPALDARLRSIARRESRAQASSYRFSSDTIGAALASGENADELARFLTEISLTGLPQPLAYELRRAAARHGGLRVGTDPTGLTEVTASDPAILRTLQVDQALRPLGLVPDGERMITRRPVETVVWMLTDARYPAMAVDADGRPRTIERTVVADEAVPASQPRHDDLLERLHAAHADDNDAAWLGRELEQAVRARAVLEVEVRLPDGGTRTFVLEATGLGGGRLRGLDRVADVERTLPVSSITAARPV